MKNVYEVFNELEKASTEDDRLQILRNNDNHALRNVLRNTYHPNIEFAITSVPYYKPSDAPIGMSYTSINQELDRAYLFQTEHPRQPPTLTSMRREQILIQILESLEAQEAQVYMNMLLKKQKVKGLDAKLVKKAFPDLI